MIEADIQDTSARITVTPERGRTITLEVAWKNATWRGQLRGGYVVRHADSGGEISRHRELHVALRSALVRARRYERAFSHSNRPRTAVA